MQHALTCIIVLACAAHATWLLMPAAARRALARRLGRPMSAGDGHGAGAHRVEACGGCGGGCGPRPAARAAVQPITLHRRRPGALGALPPVADQPSPIAGPIAAPESHSAGPGTPTATAAPEAR